MKTMNTKTSFLLLLLSLSISTTYSQSFMWANNSAAGSNSDVCSDVYTDASGNVYVTGYTNSSDFNTTAGSFQTVFGGGTNDAFIQKYNSSGALLWSTYFGGSNDDKAMDIVADAAGNIFVTGITNSSNFPTLNPGGGAYFQVALSGGYDIFVAKFNGAGMRLWSTYYGGTADDHGQSIAVNTTSGNFYITGSTSSTDFPVLNPGAGVFFQGITAGADDAFIIEFNNAGTLIWSTYYGGANADSGNAIAVDTLNNNIYITGNSASTNFPIMNPGGAYFQGINMGGIYDAFIVKFNSSRLRLWATYFGGSDLDFPNSISADPNGNIWVTGYTVSLDFPTNNPGGAAFFQASHAGGSNIDGFISKFNINSALQWSTYYGGTGADYCTSISAASDKVYITGNTGSTNFPVFNPGGGAYYQGTNGGGASDGFILRFNSSAQRLWASYFGGTGDDSGNGIITNATDVTFVTGSFENTLNLGTALTSGGSSDGFLAKIVNCDLSISIITTQQISCNGGNNGVLTASPTGGSSPFMYSWSIGSTTQYASSLVAGMYTCTVTDVNGCEASDSESLFEPPVLSFSISVIPASCGVPNGSASVFGTGGTSPYMYNWSTGASVNIISNVAAGTYSVSITDAAGCIEFTPVTVTDSCGSYSPVWPGDCNYDLTADFWDFLNIGVAFGQTGPVRPSASLTWIAQPAPNWLQTFAAANGGNNYKHADCDGNGTVDINDTSAIIANYGQTHLKKPTTNPHIATNPDIYLSTTVDTSAMGQVISIDINLGNTSLPIDSIYGIAYRINYDPALLKQVPTVSYTNSWLGTPGTDLISFEMPFHSSGYLDLAVSKNNQLNSIGSGKIGACGIVTTDNLSGFDQLTFTITNIKAITYSGNVVSLNGVGDSIVIDHTITASIANEDIEEMISVYPNPAKNHIVVNSNLYKVNEIRIVNLLGETMINLSNPNSNYIDVSSVAEGVYTIAIRVDNSWIYKKLMVSH